MFEMEQYRQSADYIASKIGDRVPEILLVLGSGLGFLGDIAEDAVSIPYGEIPHFKQSTAPGHAGRLVIGELEGKTVMVMQGRMHIYEGYSAQEATYPIRVARLLGVKNMIVTNACGAVNRDYKVGDIMLISDHIRLFDPDPLIGRNLPEFGPRFCDMSMTYTRAYREMAKNEAAKLQISLREGVYFYFTGPQYETPAEIRAARALGGDAVGMSTVPEVICAAHCGMHILGFSLIANMAAGILDKKLSEEEVLNAAAMARDHFSKLVLACIGEMREPLDA